MVRRVQLLTLGMGDVMVYHSWHYFAEAPWTPFCEGNPISDELWNWFDITGSQGAPVFNPSTSRRPEGAVFSFGVLKK